MHHVQMPFGQFNSLITGLYDSHQDMDEDHPGTPLMPPIAWELAYRLPSRHTAAMHFVNPFLVTTAAVTGFMLLGSAGFLHLLPRLGGIGRRGSQALCRAPGLDAVVTYFTVAPLLIGPLFCGFPGLLGGIAGQVIGVLIWTWLHELSHLDAVVGPRIVKVVNNLNSQRTTSPLGSPPSSPPCSGSSAWSRFSSIPPISKLPIPAYKAEWINVSRHKFSGLVGHDLIWCLYCDWMTGVYSLGAEMLRNVESFWCPIRFADGKKCANCTTDFPDVDHGWVDAAGTMAQVVEVMDKMHRHGVHAWFGHPVRLTINGKTPDSPAQT